MNRIYVWLTILIIVIAGVTLLSAWFPYNLLFNLLWLVCYWPEIKDYFGIKKRQPKNYERKKKMEW